MSTFSELSLEAVTESGASHLMKHKAEMDKFEEWGRAAMLADGVGAEPPGASWQAVLEQAHASLTVGSDAACAQLKSGLEVLQTAVGVHLIPCGSCAVGTWDTMAGEIDVCVPPTETPTVWTCTIKGWGPHAPKVAKRGNQQKLEIEKRYGVTFKKLLKSEEDIQFVAPTQELAEEVVRRITNLIDPSGKPDYSIEKGVASGETEGGVAAIARRLESLMPGQVEVAVKGAHSVVRLAPKVRTVGAGYTATLYGCGGYAGKVAGRQSTKKIHTERTYGVRFTKLCSSDQDIELTAASEAAASRAARHIIEQISTSDAPPRWEVRKTGEDSEDVKTQPLLLFPTEEARDDCLRRITQRSKAVSVPAGPALSFDWEVEAVEAMRRVEDLRPTLVQGTVDSIPGFVVVLKGCGANAGRVAGRGNSKKSVIEMTHGVQFVHLSSKHPDIEFVAPTRDAANGALEDVQQLLSTAATDVLVVESDAPPAGLGAEKREPALLVFPSEVFRDAAAERLHVRGEACKPQGVAYAPAISFRDEAEVVSAFDAARRRGRHPLRAILPSLCNRTWDVSCQHEAPRTSALLSRIVSQPGDASRLACHIVAHRWGRHNVPLPPHALTTMFAYYLVQTSRATFVDPATVPTAPPELPPAPGPLTPQVVRSAQELLCGFFGFFARFDWDYRAVTVTHPPQQTVSPADLQFTPEAAHAALTAGGRKGMRHPHVVVADPFSSPATSAGIRVTSLLRAYLLGLVAFTHAVLSTPLLPALLSDILTPPPGRMLSPAVSPPWEKYGLLPPANPPPALLQKLFLTPEGFRGADAVPGAAQ